jgi:hypothetical protein
MFRMDALAVDIVTAQSDASADAMGDQERFFLMEKELVFDILDDLNVTLTQEELDAIQKLPTESFLAFLSYSRGLDYEDRGMYHEAATEFQKAVEIDPGFSSASEKSQMVGTLAEISVTGTVDDVAQLDEPVTVGPEVKASTGMEANLSTSSRLEVIGQNTAGGFLPSPDTEEATDDRTPPQQQTRTTVNVTIEL